MMPETDRVSWVMAVISAVDSWTSRETARRFCPTFLLMTAKKGTTPTATKVSSQERMDMATTVLIRMTTLEITSVTVVVTTFRTPPTSLATRDWTSPVRVPVKKLRERLWRWRKRRSRRSRMTRWPTVLVR